MPNTPQDQTTGDKYLTQSSLADIINNINTQIGNDALKDTIEKQKEALELLRQEFEAQLQEKNDLIADLEKQVNDLLINQPLDPNNPTIGNTIIELKKQIEALRTQVAQKQTSLDNLKAELENNTNEDNVTRLDLENLRVELDNIKNGLNPNFILNDILKDPQKAQEIIKEILKNPHNFPPFNLNPLVDANADIFAQVRETLNTSREILRLMSTLDYINSDFQGDLTRIREELKSGLNELLDKRDEALKQLENVLNALENEIDGLKAILKGSQTEYEKYSLLKNEVEHYHRETFGYYGVCRDYAEFCLGLKNDCITLRDDMSVLKLDIEIIIEETRNYKDRVEFLHTSLVNMNYDNLVAKVNSLEALINTMGEQKKQEALKAIRILGEAILEDLRELFLEYRFKLEGIKASSVKILKDLSAEIIELIDDKKLESLDEINISTLSSLASIQSAKQIGLDLLRHQTDEGIEELTQHKSDYLVEIQDAKVDSINTINESFAATSKGFQAELARIHSLIASLQQSIFTPENNYKTENIITSQTWTSPDDGKFRHYFILLRGGSGYDNSNNAGGITSFGTYRSVQGGLGSPNGRGASGEHAFLTLTLAPNTEVEITIGEGRTAGLVSITYAG